VENDDVFVCRCEEVTERDVLLAIARGARDIDGVKRLTRAGMGLCQGKTCSVLIRNILHRELGIKKEDLPEATARPPLRLIPSKAFLKEDRKITESAETVKNLHQEQHWE
jgi:NAD(P)H-nitrite reductase large subunit